MRVLLIDVNCKNGSTGKIVYDLYSNLIENGISATVCYGRGPVIKERDIFKYGIDLETYLHAILSRITGYNGCFSFFSTRRLISYIEKFNPDIVHIHELHAYHINVVTLLNYLKAKDIKVIHTLHCEYSYTGKCGLSYECNKWRYQCESCPNKKGYVSSILFDKTKQMFHSKKTAFNGFSDLTLVTPSEWLTDRAKQSFLNQYRIHTIHNGIDTSVFKYISDKDIREKYSIPRDKKIVLSVAPNIMSPLKGGNIIAELSKCEDLQDFVFLLVGVDGEINSSGNLVQLPRIYNQVELAKLYSAASLFVLASVRETFSLTCAEALACGTPVVGYRCGAPEEIFKEPYARFVDYGDTEKLKSLILESLNRESNREEIASYADTNFSKKTMIQKYFKIYQGEYDEK